MSPPDLRLSRSKLRAFEPEAVRCWGLLRGPAWAGLQRHLDEGEPDAALVRSLDPPRIAAYSVELDTVVQLALAPALAAGLREGQRLVTLNLHTPLEEGFADDLEPGARGHQRHGNVIPLLAELACEPPEALDALRARVPAERWERCAEVAEVLERARSGRPLRDARPLLAGAPPPRPEEEEAGPPLLPPPPRPAHPRRGRRWLLALLLALLLAPPLLLGAAALYLRHVPYEVPPELQAPAGPGLEAAVGMGLRLRYLGCSGYELSDGQTTVWLDPTPTRPTLGQLASGPLVPDEELYAGLGLRHADFILVNHAHHDHVLDVPALAKRSGAVVVGSRGVISFCRARGVPDAQLREVSGGEMLQLRTFRVQVRAARHSRVLGMSEPLAGDIPPDAGPLWAWQFRQDGTRCYHLSAAGTSVWFHPGSRYGEESAGLRAGVVLLGIAGERPSDEDLARLVRETRPTWVLPTHYDNFFQPLARGLALLPGVDPLDLRRRLLAVDPALSVYLLDHGQQVFLPVDGVKLAPSRRE
ncbi:MAG: MBL fold metallo-hydrolase [Planctomycetota bacterium]